MHLYGPLFACFTLVQCTPLQSPSSNLLRSLGLPVDEIGATAFSLIYGTPLLAFLQIANQTVASQKQNRLLHNNATATAATVQVVRPNVDTIYAEAVFDLSATDLILKLPPMEADRFYLAAFFDPYGDTFASIGSVTGSVAGSYLLQSRNGSCHGYEGCITSPTTIGTLLLRVEVKNNTTDTAYVDSYLTNASLTAINPITPTVPALTSKDFANLSSKSAVSVLQLTARLESRAAPESALYKAAVPAILAVAGISKGSYTPPSGLNLTQAVALVNTTTMAFTKKPSSYPSLGNGWSILNSSYIGTFENGTALVARALAATSLYLANSANEALYPSLASTQLSLTDSEAYIFTFSGKPPVASDGFWSVTMYNDVGYLVANALNKYSVGDRSNITFPSGDLVYGNKATADGTFQVLVQNADVPPPRNWTANWLPAPPGGADFTVTFRLYAPEAAASNGSYVYPFVKKGAAITA